MGGSEDNDFEATDVDEIKCKLMEREVARRIQAEMEKKFRDMEEYFKEKIMEEKTINEELRMKLETIYSSKEGEKRNKIERENEYLKKELKEVSCKFEEVSGRLNEMIEKNELRQNEKENKKRMNILMDRKNDKKESDSSSTQESASEGEKKRRKKKKNKQGVYMGRFPKPTHFELDMGQSWEDFIRNFEDLCGRKYGHEMKYSWSSELGSLLEGEMKKMFESYGGGTQPYEEMKENLTKYVKRIKKAKFLDEMKFETVRMELGETAVQFAARLETLFKREYPRDEWETSKILLRKLCDCLPKTVTDQLTQFYYNMRAVSKRELTWTDIVEWLMSLENNNGIQQPSGQRYSDILTGGIGQNRGLQNPSQGPVNFGTGNLVQCLKCNGTGWYDKSNAGFNYNMNQNRNQGARLGNQSQGSCTFCKRVGHQFANCRRRLKLCLKCGGNDHFVKDCTKAGNNKSNRTLECYICGDNHLARDCDKRFKRQGASSNNNSGN